MRQSRVPEPHTCLLCKLLMLFSLVVGFFELEKYFESEFKVPNGAQPDILEKLKLNPF